MCQLAAPSNCRDQKAACTLRSYTLAIRPTINSEGISGKNMTNAMATQLSRRTLMGADRSYSCSSVLRRQRSQSAGRSPREGSGLQLAVISNASAARRTRRFRTDAEVMAKGREYKAHGARTERAERLSSLASLMRRGYCMRKKRCCLMVIAHCFSIFTCLRQRSPSKWTAEATTTRVPGASIRGATDGFWQPIAFARSGFPIRMFSGGRQP